MSIVGEHPDYYNQQGRKECWDEFIDNYGAKKTFVWCLMTAQKYLYRSGYKEGNPSEMDYDKAVNYFNKAKSIREDYPEVAGYSASLYNKTRKELTALGKI